jgi:hypothetical protein
MGFEHQIAVYLKQYNNIIILMCIITNLCNVFCSMWTTRPFPNEFGHATASVYCSMWVLYFHLLLFIMTYSLNFYIEYNSIKIIFYTNIIFLLLHMYTLWEINKFKMRNNRGERTKKKNVYSYLRGDHRNFDRQFPHTRTHTPTHCWIMLIKIGLPLFPINYHICIIWVKRIKQFNAIHSAGI